MLALTSGRTEDEDVQTVTGPDDPRQADVDDARQLVAAAERSGGVTLPALSEAELYAAGAAGQSLIDDDSWSRWMSLSDDQRSLLTEIGLDLLSARGLLGPQDSAGPDDAEQAQRPARPGLAMILTARARPSLIVACQLPGRSFAHEPRMYGIAEQDRGLRVLVLEHLTSKRADPVRNALGRTIEYFLISPAKAAEMLATWARAPVSPAGLRRERPPRVVDIYRGRDRAAGGLARERIQVRSGRDGLQVELSSQSGPAGPAVTCDQAGLADLMTSALLRMAP